MAPFLFPRRFKVENQGSSPLVLYVTPDPNHQLTAKSAFNASANMAGCSVGYETALVLAKDTPVQVKSLGAGRSTSVKILGSKAFLTVTTSSESSMPAILKQVGGWTERWASGCESDVSGRETDHSW